MHHCPKFTLKEFYKLYKKKKKKIKELENVTSWIQKEICNKSITMNSNIADDIEEVMNKNLNVSPFMKLYWEQQKSS